MRCMFIASPEAPQSVQRVTRQPLVGILSAIRFWMPPVFLMSGGGLVGYVIGNVWLPMCLFSVVGLVLAVLILWGNVIAVGAFEQKMATQLTDPGVIKAYRDAQTRLAKLPQPSKQSRQHEQGAQPAPPHHVLFPALHSHYVSAIL